MDESAHGIGDIVEDQVNIDFRSPDPASRPNDDCHMQ